MRSRRSLFSGAALAAAVVALGATSLMSTAAQAATPPGLHISGTQLVEKDGTPFVARGVSHAHTWYASQTATAIPAITPSMSATWVASMPGSGGGRTGRVGHGSGHHPGTIDAGHVRAGPPPRLSRRRS